MFEDENGVQVVGSVPNANGGGNRRQQPERGGFFQELRSTIASDIIDAAKTLGDEVRDIDSDVMEMRNHESERNKEHSEDFNNRMVKRYGVARQLGERMFEGARAGANALSVGDNDMGLLGYEPDADYEITV